MRIHWIQLNNFRQHANSRIEIPLGMSSIVGRNGVGKSTIAESIKFALFGEQRDSKDSIRFAWATTKKFSATVRFELDGRQLEVMRSNDTAYLKEIQGTTERTLATSLSEVTKVVERTLGLTSEQFTNSLYVEQKNLTFLNFKSNSDRQKEVAKMLGFDRLQQAEDLAREKAKTARLKVEALAQVLGDFESLKADASARESELAGIVEELGKVCDRHSQLEVGRQVVELRAKQAQEYSELSTAIQTLGGRYSALKEAKDVAAAEFSAANAQVERRQEIQEQAQKYPKLADELKVLATAKEQVGKRRELGAEAEAKANEIKVLESKVASIKCGDPAKIEAEIEALVSEVKTLDKVFQAENDAWIARKSEAASALAVAQSRLQAAEKELARAQARASEGICASCGQALPESALANVSEYEEAVAEARLMGADAESQAKAIEPESLASARVQIQEKDADIHSLRNDLRTAQEQVRERDQILGKIEVLKQAISGIELQLQGLASAYDVSREHTLRVEAQMLEPLHREWQSLAGASERLKRAQAQFDIATANINAAKSENDSLRAKRALLGFDAPEDAVRAVDALVLLNTESRTLTTEMNGLGQRKAQAEAAVATAKSRIEEYRKREAEIKELASLRVLNEVLAQEMKALRLQLNAGIAPELSARASEILSLLTGGRYTVLELNDKFEASLVDDGVNKAVLSGGEEDIKDLALRLALAQLIQERQGRPMSLLILDEIFGSLDADRRQTVLDCLIGLKSLFSQIILISHIEGTSEVADNIVYLHRDPESKATVVGDGPESMEVAA
jgi:DNA repair protein SbcC/Rad50